MLSIYCRISKNRKNQVSIEAQIEAGTELAKQNGWEYEIYIDKGISGRKRNEERPEYLRLMNDLRIGKIDNVFVYDRSRNDRDVKTWVELAEYLRQHGIPLYMKAKDGYNKLDLQDTATYYMQVQYAVKDEMFAVETGDKIKDALRVSAERGRGFAIAPLGYKILDEDHDKQLVIDEDTKHIVERIFKLSIEGVGLDRMAEMFNAEGIPTKYNKLKGEYIAVNRYSERTELRKKSDVKWKGNTIRNIIKNPIYKGERHFSGGVYNAPVIIEPEYWQRANDNLKNRGNNHGGSQKHSYLLKGLLRCGKCNRNYYGRTRPPQVNRHGKQLKPRDNYYMCSSKRKNEKPCGNRSINIEVLDALIWVNLFIDKRLAKQVQEFYTTFDNTEELESIEKELKHNESKLKAIDTDVKALTLNHARGMYDDKTYLSILSDIRKDEQSLNNRILSLKTRRNDLLRMNDDKGQILNEVGSYMQESDNNVRREILKKYIDFILVTYDAEKAEYEVRVNFQLKDVTPIVYYIDKQYKRLRTESKPVNIDVNKVNNRTGKEIKYKRTAVSFNVPIGSIESMVEKMSQQY